MTRWVTRRDVNGKQEGQALRCLRPGSIASEPGLMAIEHGVLAILRDGEICEGLSNKRPVKKDGVFVGYIDISEDKP